jgi:hypothetical protein
MGKKRCKNTDVISKFKNSKLQIHPIFFASNELPIEKRFCINHVIIYDLSIGYSKPYKPFMLPIYNELKLLETWLLIKFANRDKMIKKFYEINSFNDSPARAALLNLKASMKFLAV